MPHAGRRLCRRPRRAAPRQGADGALSPSLRRPCPRGAACRPRRLHAWTGLCGRARPGRKGAPPRSSQACPLPGVPGGTAGGPPLPGGLPRLLLSRGRETRSASRSRALPAGGPRLEPSLSFRGGLGAGLVPTAASHRTANPQAACEGARGARETFFGTVLVPDPCTRDDGPGPAHRPFRKGVPDGSPAVMARSSSGGSGATQTFSFSKPGTRMRRDVRVTARALCWPHVDVNCGHLPCRRLSHRRKKLLTANCLPVSSLPRAAGTVTPGSRGQSSPEFPSWGVFSGPASLSARCPEQQPPGSPGHRASELWSLIPVLSNPECLG